MDKKGRPIEPAPGVEFFRDQANTIQEMMQTEENLHNMMTLLHEICNFAKANSASFLQAIGGQFAHSMEDLRELQDIESLVRKLDPGLGEHEFRRLKKGISRLAMLEVLKVYQHGLPGLVHAFESGSELFEKWGCFKLDMFLNRAQAGQLDAAQKRWNGDSTINLTDRQDEHQQFLRDLKVALDSAFLESRLAWRVLKEMQDYQGDKTEAFEELPRIFRNLLQTSDPRRFDLDDAVRKANEAFAIAVAVSSTGLHTYRSLLHKLLDDVSVVLGERRPNIDFFLAEDNLQKAKDKRDSMNTLGAGGQ